MIFPPDNIFGIHPYPEALPKAQSLTAENIIRIIHDGVVHEVSLGAFKAAFQRGDLESVLLHASSWPAASAGWH